MSLKKAIISTVAAAAITTSVSAATANLNGLGNYLVFPAYNAHAEYGNWSTDLRVVNTNETHAIIAKVVIRGAVDSVELLDFPLYLSPGDVWVGQLKDIDGVVNVVSTDDSMIINGNIVNDTNNSVQQPLFNLDTITPVDGYKAGQQGYVEVYTVAKALATDIDPTWTVGGVAAVGTPLKKMEIFNSFKQDRRKTAGSCTTSGAARDCDVWNLQGGVAQALDVDLTQANDLYATEVISADDTGAERAMTLMASAFTLQDTEIDTAGALTSLNSLTGDAVAGYGTGTLVSQDSIYDNMYSINAVDNRALAGDIEAVIARTNIYATYYTDAEAETQLIFSQPAKHYHFDGITEGDAHDLEGYYDQNVTIKKFYYETRVRNNTENTFVAPPSETDDFSGSPTQVITNPRHEARNEVQRLSAIQDNTTTGYTSGYVHVTTYDNIKHAANGGSDTPNTVPMIPVQMTGVTVGTNGAVVTNIFYPASN